MKPHELTREEIGNFRRDGFHCIPQFFAHEEIAVMRRVLTRASRDRGMRIADLAKRGDFENPYHRMVVQLLNLWREYEEIRPFVLNPHLAEIARRLIGTRSIRLFHDHALIKAPRSNTETPWHQDSSLLCIQPPRAIVCWIALDDVGEENGALSYIPGSHRLGVLERVDFENPKSILFKTDGEGKGRSPIQMKLKAGGCCFHHSSLIHRGGPNRTSRPRRALSLVYVPQGSRYEGATPSALGETRVDPGDRLVGKDFPLLAKS